jgi:hypothetical protein
MRQLTVALSLMRMALALLEEGGHITVSWRLREAIEDIENSTTGLLVGSREIDRAQDAASDGDDRPNSFGRLRF